MTNATDIASPATDATTAAPAGLQQIDPRPLLTIAADLASSVVASIGADQLELRTPCDQFSVYDLLDHLRLVALRAGDPDVGEEAFGHGSELPSGLPAADLQADWAQRIEATKAVWAEDRRLSQMVSLPWATMPGAGMLLMYISEITCHTWDLAQATGQHIEFDPAVAGASLALMKMALPEGGRAEGGIPFGDVVAVPDDAPLIDQLLGWTGRNPFVTA